MAHIKSDLIVTHMVRDIVRWTIRKPCDLCSIRRIVLNTFRRTGGKRLAQTGATSETIGRTTMSLGIGKNFWKKGKGEANERLIGKISD